MSVRRGEVPFVAIRVGLSNDPRVLALARELKVERATALGYVALWQELILEVGDALTGRIKGYTAQHVAAKLGHEGNPRRLVDALKRAGELAQHRGTLRHPSWGESITGHYAARKAEDRETWTRQKNAQRDAARLAALEAAGAQPPHEQGVDVHPVSTWTRGGRPPAVQVENAHKERKGPPGQPPQPPAKRGESKGFARWRWVLDNHHSPMNPSGCARILEAMTDEDWELFRWASTPAPDGGPRSSSRKMRILAADSYRILSTGAYLKFRPEWREKLRPKNGAPKAGAAPKADPAAAAASRTAAALPFVLQQLEDEPSEEKRAKIRARFEQLHPGVPLPWARADGGVANEEITVQA
jgi:hypothetical protein